MAKEIEKKWIASKSALNITDVAARASSVDSMSQAYIKSDGGVSLRDGVDLYVGDKLLLSVTPEIASEIRNDIFMGADAADTVNLRIRSIKSQDTDIVKNVFTLKDVGDNVSRGEVEFEIPDVVYSQLKEITYSSISKNRYKIPDDQYLIELDVFDNPDFEFVMVEVEFSDIDTLMGYQLPEWLLSVGVHDVTSEKAFKNKNLAQTPSSAIEFYRQIQGVE